MADARLEFGLGKLSFQAEGGEEWLGEQLNKILGLAVNLGDDHPALQSEVMPETEAQDTSALSGDFTDSLASYIKSKGGETNQAKRFLITSDWLRRRGTAELTTGSVTKALSDHHQKRLANPADCLNKNVAKGACEKKGKGFFITPDGLKELGHS